MGGTILVATDGSDTGGRALDCAAEMSAKLGRDLCIVHVLMHGRPTAEMTRLVEGEHLVEHVAAAGATAPGQSPALGDYLTHAPSEVEAARVIAVVGEQILDRAKRRAEDAGARNVETHLRSGDFAEEILDVAETEGAGMIVLGNRGLGRIRGALLGSVSQKVLHHAPCTTVVVR